MTYIYYHFRHNIESEIRKMKQYIADSNEIYKPVTINISSSNLEYLESLCNELEDIEMDDLINDLITESKFKVERELSEELKKTVLEKIGTINDNNMLQWILNFLNCGEKVWKYR